MKRLENVTEFNVWTVPFVPKINLALVFTWAVLPMTGSGAVILIPGNPTLIPGTSSQTVTLYVDNQGSSPVQVDGLSFILQIGDGGPEWGGTAGPTVTGVDLHTGTAFEPNYSAELNQDSTPQLAQYSITTSSGSVSLPVGQRKLATVTISTEGFTTIGQKWDFNLAFNIPSSGFDYTPSDYSFMGGSVGATLVSGELTLVPEPNSAVAVGGLLIAIGGLWRWNNRRKAA